MTKDSNPLPTQSQTISPDTNEKGFPILQSLLLRQHLQLTKVSLIYLSPLTKEPGKKQEVLQKAQLESKSAVKEVKEENATISHYSHASLCP